MDILIKADNYLNGNHHLLNIIFSYLGESPSAKVIGELIGLGEEMKDVWFNTHIFTNNPPILPKLYFSMRKNWRINYKIKKYEILNVPRFKVDVLGIEDDVDCERCNKLLTYPERNFYEGYCEYCYGKRYNMGRESDEEPEPDTDDSESETDED